MRDQCVNAHWDHGGPLSYEAGSMEIERWPVLVLQRAGWLVGGALHGGLSWRRAAAGWLLTAHKDPATTDFLS